MEPILQPQGNDRYILYNPLYKDLWNLYKIHSQTFWTAEDIDYDDRNDLRQWKNELGDDERHFIKMILAFFAGADGIVIDNLVTNFTSEVQIKEAGAFYAIQTAIETIHAETYALLIEALISDPEEKKTLLNAIDTIPVIQKKAQWAIKWISTDRPFAERLIAFAVVEGVFFSGAFCSIFWLKTRGLLVNILGHSNELIARDEKLHVDFAVALFHKLIHKPTEEIVHEIIREAVAIEKEFILEAVPCKLLGGMDENQMSQYIEYVADRLLQQLGYSSIYNVSCPFQFMMNISIPRKTNFFEGRPSEYAKLNEGAKKITPNAFQMNCEDTDEF